MQLNGVSMGGMDNKTASFGGMSTRVAAMFAVGVVAAIAGASAFAGAARIDQLDRSSDSTDFVAGIALFASAVLVGVVALARTRLAAQEAEIERLRARIVDAELRSEWCASDDDWNERMFDPVADRAVLRVSDR